jgi:hypothetical protein
MTSIELTVPYITLKILVPIKRYTVSNIHINVYTEMLQRYKTVLQTAINFVELLIIILTTLPKLGYRDPIYCSTF